MSAVTAGPGTGESWFGVADLERSSQSSGAPLCKLRLAVEEPGNLGGDFVWITLDFGGALVFGGAFDGLGNTGVLVSGAG